MNPSLNSKIKDNILKKLNVKYNLFKKKNKNKINKKHCLMIIHNNVKLSEYSSKYNLIDSKLNLFHLSVIFNKHKMLKYMLQKSNNHNIINYPSKDGMTALMYASMFGRMNIVKLLIKEGADKSIKDNKGKTALDHAIDNKYTKIEELLLL